jgi:glyoxylase-like metal-dependent hydrolase (beta-lactamase superfamily II)
VKLVRAITTPRTAADPAATELYEVSAVRYGTRETTASDVFLNYHVYREPDRPLRMDYFFWVIRGGQRVIVVDTGFSPEGGAARGRIRLMSTKDAARAAGASPDAVEQVVVTHAHYDHIGGLTAFPDAEVIMTAAEYGFWTGPMAGRRQFAHAAEPGELDYLRKLRDAGRLTLTGERHTVAPGVEMIQVGGHTPGQAILTVPTRSGRVVLASDAMHYYEELDRDWPFCTVADVAGMYAGFDYLRGLAADPGTRVVAGHDPEVLVRFPAGDENVVVLS